MDSNELARRVLALRPGWRAKDLGDFVFLAGGYSNRNYRFRHGDHRYVLRLPERERPFVDRSREGAFYRAPGAVRVPRIEAFETASGAMISRWEPGALLCDAEPDASALVPFVRRLHGQLAPCGRTYDPIGLSRVQLSSGGAPEDIVALAARLEWRPPETTACHNDLNPWNVICGEDGEWVTLDWEWLGDNDPLFDLVVLHQGLDLAVDLLRELARELVPTADESRLRHCLSAFWLREYAFAHAELTHGNDRDELRAQRRTARARLRELGALPVL